MLIKTAIEPAVVLMLGAAVAFVALAMFTPLIALIDRAGETTGLY